MLYGCRNSYELSMERGEYYYNVGAYESAALEYKSVVNHYPRDVGVLDEKTIHMLANAHHNLAVIHLKRATQTQNLIKKTSFLGRILGWDFENFENSLVQNWTAPSVPEPRTPAQKSFGKSPGRLG